MRRGIFYSYTNDLLQLSHVSNRACSWIRVSSSYKLNLSRLMSGLRKLIQRAQQLLSQGCNPVIKYKTIWENCMDKLYGCTRSATCLSVTKNGMVYIVDVLKNSQHSVVPSKFLQYEQTQSLFIACPCFWFGFLQQILNYLLNTWKKYFCSFFSGNSQG